MRRLGDIAGYLFAFALIAFLLFLLATLVVILWKGVWA